MFFASRFYRQFLLSVFVLMVLYACKKKSQTPEPEPLPVTGTRDELTKDSIFYYAKEVYYWYDALPAYSTFKPRGYNSSTDQFANFEKELFAISQLKINSLTGRPYEYVSASADYPKYSYITDITKQNPVAYINTKKSSVDLEGNGNDFGMLVRPYGTVSSYRFYVQAVYPGSPAEKAGIKRGDNFNVINGTTIGTNYSGEYDFFYSALFESSSITIGGKKRDNSTLSVTLNKASYRSSPIYKDTIYTAESKKIGYIAYARFSNPTNSTSEFDRIFSDFASKGVTDLIIDLRYNGGGYVSSAEYLANCIAPSSLTGSVMFTEYFNTLMQQNYSRRKTSPTAPLLAKQYILDANDNKQDINGDGKWDTYADEDFSASSQITRFSKHGSLAGINKVVFIVTGSTASASELVINSLKPYMTVKIVGTQSYGKPVGFFPIRIDKYDVYFSMFETKNSAGTGGYFTGMTPDISANDGVNYDMWDLNEPSLSAAYSYIISNTVSSVSSKSNSSKTLAKSPVLLEVPGNSFEDFEFKGMIENRIKIK